MENLMDSEFDDLFKQTTFFEGENCSPKYESYRQCLKIYKFLQAKLERSQEINSSLNMENIKQRNQIQQYMQSSLEKTDQISNQEHIISELLKLNFDQLTELNKCLERETERNNKYAQTISELEALLEKKWAEWKEHADMHSQGESNAYEHAMQLIEKLVHE